MLFQSNPVYVDRGSPLIFGLKEALLQNGAVGSLQVAVIEGSSVIDNTAILLNVNIC
ncbi:hypothetical protein SAMN04488513_103237 [Pseudozobellia thermophila]|uniref:Uncharacterized protein n=1 Tax=Pseudozobellia thermophila TaxID=192903 RepID=A0A1M6HYA0_9FLAO|nr:hypothetical protein SAMN04488513_103237 [Pseudozobellia thermophila]